MSRRRAASAMAAAFLLGLVGCSGNPPVISRVSRQLLYVNDLSAGVIHEALSLHVVAEDEDGFDDLEFVHLISDDEELYWTLDAESWLESQVENQQWIGTNRIVTADLEPLPRGEYRLLLADLGGDIDEQTFTLDIPPIPRTASTIPFPRAVTQNDRIRVEGAFESYTLLAFTTAEEYVKSVTVQQEPVAVRSISSGEASLRGGFIFYLYVYWERGEVGLLVGPYAVD